METFPLLPSSLVKEDDAMDKVDAAAMDKVLLLLQPPRPIKQPSAANSLFVPSSRCRSMSVCCSMNSDCTNDDMAATTFNLSPEEEMRRQLKAALVTNLVAVSRLHHDDLIWFSLLGFVWRSPKNSRHALSS